ncbi:sulfur relay protein DsrC [Candidatus Vondammii sp. HM_W22]|uniref:sulfur relay protein DsrC n=1 Tax=Candidatus Vondammii sp. HM_W22 TaxID=2687299 RepID=UPI001F1298BF|nr:sulfur relay protein DsrC [Candidatus Vondammii sp. HM_W22]
MLLLSEVMIQSPDVETFEELIELIKIRRQGTTFFRIDVKPQFSDTPEDWEDRLEAAFT